MFRYETESGNISETLQISRKTKLLFLKALRQALLRSSLLVFKYPDNIIVLDMKELFDGNSTDIRTVHCRTSGSLFKKFQKCDTLNKVYFEMKYAKSDYTNRVKAGFNYQIDDTAAGQYFPMSAVLVLVYTLGF